MRMKLKKLLYSTKYWNVYLINEQSYLGRGRVELKKNKPTLSDLTDNEWSDFGTAVKQYEKMIKNTFRAVMFNWTCMMNNAYAADEKERPQVHFHVRPRYDRDIEFAGHVFQDPTFGNYYDRSRKIFIEEKLFSEIYKELADKV